MTNNIILRDFSIVKIESLDNRRRNGERGSESLHVSNGDGETIFVVPGGEQQPAARQPSLADDQSYSGTYL